MAESVDALPVQRACSSQFLLRVERLCVDVFRELIARHNEALVVGLSDATHVSDLPSSDRVRLIFIVSIAYRVWHFQGSAPLTPRQ